MSPFFISVMSTGVKNEKKTPPSSSNVQFNFKMHGDKTEREIQKVDHRSTCSHQKTTFSELGHQ